MLSHLGIAKCHSAEVPPTQHKYWWPVSLLVFISRRGWVAQSTNCGVSGLIPGSSSLGRHGTLSFQDSQATSSVTDVCACIGELRGPTKTLVVGLSTNDSCISCILDPLTWWHSQTFGSNNHGLVEFRHKDKKPGTHLSVKITLSPGKVLENHQNTLCGLLAPGHSQAGIADCLFLSLPLGGA